MKINRYQKNHKAIKISRSIKKQISLSSPLFQSGKQVNIGCFPTAILLIFLMTLGSFLVHRVDSISIRLSAFLLILAVSVAVYIFFKKKPWKVSIERAVIWIGLMSFSACLLFNIFFWVPFKSKQAEYRPSPVPVPCLQSCPAFYYGNTRWYHIPVSALSTPVWINNSSFSTRVGFRGQETYSVTAATRTTSNNLAILEITGWCSGYGTDNFRAGGTYKRIQVLDKIGTHIIFDSLSDSPRREEVDASKLGLYSEMPTWLFQDLCYSIRSSRKSP